MKFDERTNSQLCILYELYGVMIKKIAFQYLGDSGLAEDCMQEVMLKLAKILENLEDYASPRTKSYIYVITKNTAFDLLAKRKHEQCVNQEQTIDNRDKQLQSEDRYFVGAWDIDQGLWNLLDKLSDLDREIFILHYIDGRPYDQIAVLLGRPRTTIEKRMSRSRNRLRQMIADDAE